MGIPVDAEGIRTDMIADRLNDLRRQGRRAKLIYTIVNFQNPAGPTMSLRRRQELLQLAYEHEVPVLEDDAYGELRFEGEALPSLYKLDRHGLVSRAGTISKILGAGTRIGWILAPSELIPHFQGFKFDGGTSPLVSRLVTYYLREHMDEHIQELIGVYHTKRDAMLETLDEVLGDTDAEWSRPEGGFFIWVKLPTGGEARKVVELAKGEQVTVVPGMSFMPNGGGENYIRLAFSYASPDDIREGTRRLGKAVKAAL
jgi:2-aminoadipate transaminase